MSNKDSPLFSRFQLDKLNTVINELSKETRAICVIFSHASGQPIISAGELNLKQIANLSALTGGSFAATQEISRTLKEAHPFKYLLFEGEKTMVYLSSVKENYFLVGIHPQEVPLGFIRFYFKKSINSITQILSVEAREESIKDLQNVFDAEFSSLLEEALEESFKDDLEEDI